MKSILIEVTKKPFTVSNSDHGAYPTATTVCVHVCCKFAMTILSKANIECVQKLPLL